MQLTINHLKARRNYIIAKVTRIASAEDVKRYMALMAYIVDDENFEGTILDLFNRVHEQCRPKSRSSKMAEVVSNIHEKTSGENYNYAKNKLGSSVAKY